MIDKQIPTSDRVAKLWRECKTLQSAGVSYHNYVTELTFLLFLKMMKETKQEARLPGGYRWAELAKRQDGQQLKYYQKMLLDLGNPRKTNDSVVLAIFSNAQTQIRLPKDLQALITAIDKINWFSAREDGIGDLYEGLLEKTTTATKTKAGQYFTPRPLIDSIVSVMKPQAGEIIQDPAAGTGGFLVAADRYIKDQTGDMAELTKKEVRFQRTRAFTGYEWVPDTHRLCLMNLLLHEIHGPVICADTLSASGQCLEKADLILTNPPFNKMTGVVDRQDFSVTLSERVGPMPFLEHAVRALNLGGRGAVILPDNILFGNGVGGALRTWLMDLCDLHTILRLPAGIFYAQGVRSNVLFFTRGKSDQGNTKKVWFFDLRTNIPAFGKTRPLVRADFAEFEKAYGDDPSGRSRRRDRGINGRFRAFSREEIMEKNDCLDVTWLQDDMGELEQSLTDPGDIAAAIASHLRNALEEIDSLAEELGSETEQFV
jgi:type I restriction enzyme M protein